MQVYGEEERRGRARRKSEEEERRGFGLKLHDVWEAVFTNLAT